MAATQDGLGRVVRKRGIEVHGTQEILRGNHREMDRHIANSGKRSTKTANITRCLHDFEKPRLFFRLNTFTRSRLTKIKVIFIIDRAKCFHSFKVREESHNLTLAPCIVSGEVETLGWPSLQARRNYLKCVLVHKCLHGIAPSYLLSEFRHAHLFHGYNTRSRDLLRPPFAKTTKYQGSLRINGTRTFNTLPRIIRQVDTLSEFKRRLKRHFKQ